MTVVLPAEPERPAARQRISRAAWSWALFEAGQIPYLFLITGYVFMPYFTKHVVGDPVEGQALVAGAVTVAGLFVALTAPFLGASIDMFGPRKPWLAAGTLALAGVTASMWWALPGGAGLPIIAILAMIVIAKLSYGYLELFHNSLLAGVAGRRNISRVSALGMLLGNVLAVGVVLFMLWGVMLPGTVDSPLVPDAPLFGLDRAEFETSRFAGPLTAFLLITLSLPLFLFVQDVPRTGIPIGRALRQGAATLKALPKLLRGNRDVSFFLIGRMLYADGVAALVMFTGLYAAGVMNWTATELLTLGLLRTTAGALGALCGGFLEERLGSRTALQCIVTMVCVFFLGMLSCTNDTVFFFVTIESPQPIWSVPFIDTLPEVVFVTCSLGLSFCIIAASTSSRSLLVKLTPAEKTGSFFGLFAVAGTATAWLAPLLVDIFTRAFDSQRAGFAPLLGLVLLGLLAFMCVRGGNEKARDL